MIPPRTRFLICSLVLSGLALACGGGGGGGSGGSGTGGPTGPAMGFDFQGSAGAVMAGFTAVTPADAYSAEQGHGFTIPPERSVDGSAHAWLLFGRVITVPEAVPGSVLSDATLDCVSSAGSMEFRVDVEPGTWDVTLWLGDVTTPRHQVRASVNGVVVDAERMDINHQRGSLDEALFGTAAPRSLRVAAPDGRIEVVLASHPDGALPITWTYEQDEDPKNPPETKTATLVPAFSEAALQAMTLHPAADPPLKDEGGQLVRGDAPTHPGLKQALDLYNAGDMAGARTAFQALTLDSLRGARAAGLFWVAGHPATIEDELDLLDEAATLLEAVLADEAGDTAAADLLLQVAQAGDAERSRSLFGYEASGAPAVENLGRSCSLTRSFGPGHPYERKGQILWLRNRGGLDPRRVTVSWERAQWLARQLDPTWGALNPYVHLYATDAWSADGKPWTRLDWGALAGAGPAWALDLVRNLNGWLDLFEWWAIQRQSADGDLGGGWTDDVEVAPAFGLMAWVLDGASDIARDSLERFADGIWNSGVIDTQAGYQAAYADVEHTAEATGNLLHVAALVRFGDPVALEQALRSARTFDTLFLSPAGGGHRHFLGNHLSATEIALNPLHRADIPLCGRVVAPFSFLLWYSDNPGVEQPLADWVGAWADDAARTDASKPAGVFPNAVWTPTDAVGLPSAASWWGADGVHGQFTALPFHHTYLYNLCGALYLRTGEARYRAPFDALRDLALAWHLAGRPPPNPEPRPGDEALWCGAMLADAIRGSAANLAAATGRSDWDSYLSRFAGPYGAFRLDPGSATSFPDLAAAADELAVAWPYRTTEGVMTDRILRAGWAEVISYYLGADAGSVFQGMPVHAATWSNTTRLFAAAVTQSTSTALAATTYLFQDSSRRVSLRCWRLEQGADYLLEAGPSTGLGAPPSPVEQSVPFRYDRLGEGASFDLPGRSTYAVRVRQLTRPDGLLRLRPDLALGAADLVFDAEVSRLIVNVHNLGAVAAPAVSVRLFQGPDATGPLLGSVTLPSLAAPTDLVPKRAELFFGHDGSFPVTVLVDADGALDEIQEGNNQATAWAAGVVPGLPPPMLIQLDPSSLVVQATAVLHGRNFHAEAELLLDQEPTTLASIAFVDAERLDLTLAAGLGAGTHLVSIRNPDGRTSNLLPLTVTD